MDDLSINISGIAPAAARTVAAVSKGSSSKKTLGTKQAPGKQGKEVKARPKKAKGAAASAPSSAYASKVKEWKSSRFKKDMKEVEEETKAETGASKKQEKLGKRKARAELNEKLEKKRKTSMATSGKTPVLKPEKQGKTPIAKGKVERQNSQKPKPKKPIKAAKLEGDITSKMKFSSIKLHESLQRQLEYLNFTDCTPIQSLAIPRALTGKRDLMLRAPTGSGKTLAFLLPVIHQLLMVPGGLDRRPAIGGREVECYQLFWV